MRAIELTHDAVRGLLESNAACRAGMAQLWKETAEEVRLDEPRSLTVIERGGRIVQGGGAGVVDHDVEVGMARDDHSDRGGDALRVGDVESDDVDAGALPGDVSKNALPPPGDNDGVASVVQGFGEGAADA